MLIPQELQLSPNFPPFKLVAVTVKMKISVEREDGEKTEVEKTLVFKAGCSKITFRTALSAFIAMKITVYFSYSLPPPNA
uniref:hypothetical protein n=1 Tax=Phocaeicola massiliensis TaxID=204516 RepID=UPI0040287D8F